MEVQKLLGAQPLVKAKLLWEEADAPSRFHVPERPPEDAESARRGSDESVEHLDCGSLARTVRTEKPEHLAALDSQ